MSELKPCPFCGCRILLLEAYEVRKGWEAAIPCNNCPVVMTTITYDTEEQAIEAVTKAWNRRAENA